MGVVAFPRPYWPHSGALPPWSTPGQGASLYFGNATSNRIEIATPSADVTTLSVATRIVWARSDTASAAQAFSFRSVTGGSGSLNGWNLTGANGHQIFLERATQNMSSVAPLANFSSWRGLGFWHCFIATYDLSLASADQIIYIGSEYEPPVMPSAYTLQRVGSGTVATETGTLYFGNNVAGNQGFRGQIASMKIFPRVLTYGELLLEAGALAPIVPGCVFWRLPGASGLAVQPDYMPTGSGLGVVTGATLSPFFPMKPLWAMTRAWDLQAAAAAASPWHYYAQMRQGAA